MRSAHPVRPVRKKGGPGRYDRTLPYEERKAEQRRRIVDAGVVVFARGGDEPATVREVLDASGVSRATFYEHFADMRELLLAAHAHASSVALGVTFAGASGERDPMVRIRRALEAFFAVVAENAAVASMAFRAGRGAGADFEARRELGTARYVAFVMEALAEAHGAGTLSRPPDEITVYALVSAVESVAMRCLARGGPLDADVVAKLYELVLRAFR